jgi:hypothetical protein
LYLLLNLGVLHPLNLLLLGLLLGSLFGYRLRDQLLLLKLLNLCYYRGCHGLLFKLRLLSLLLITSSDIHSPLRSYRLLILSLDLVRRPSPQFFYVSWGITSVGGGGLSPDEVGAGEGHKEEG